MLVKLLAAGFSAVLMSYCFADQKGQIPSATDQQVRPNIVTPPKPPDPGTDLREAAKNQAAEQMPSMMPMSLVAPMFVEDAATANTLTIVHDAATQATAEIAIVNLLGKKIATFSKPIATHGQTTVVLADELAKLGIVGPVAGSLIATPTPSNVSLAGQLSIFRKGIQTEDIEEELPMIDSSRRNAFTALATGATGDPIIALRSSSSQAQTLSITCIAQHQTPSRTQRILLPNQGLFIDPCTGQDAVPTLQNAKQVFSKPSVIGVMIESTALPGSLSVFGIAPRSVSPFLTYEPLQFQQTGAIGQLTNVYNGVPLGPTDELQGVDYQPEVGLTNFGSTSIHVSLALAKSASGQPQSLANVTVPPNSSIGVPLPEVIGDPGMANTVTMQSDATDLQLISNLRVISKADPLHFIEIPNKNLAKSTNGGQHPWVLNKTTNSKVYLYNGTAETKNPTVRVYTGSQAWIMPIKLGPSETKVLDIRALFINKVKDSKGRILTGIPDSGIEGIASWSSLKTKSVHGRVLQIDGATSIIRNFACEVVYIACAADWDPFDFYTELGQTNQASGGADECPSVGACTCDGSSCPGGTISEADGYGWYVFNSSIAPIVAGNYSSQATLYGSAQGNTNLSLSVSDVNGCFGEGQGPVTVTPSCTVSINSLSIANDQISSSLSPSELSGAFSLWESTGGSSNYSQNATLRGGGNYTDSFNLATSTPTGQYSYVYAAWNACSTQVISSYGYNFYNFGTAHHSQYAPIAESTCSAGTSTAYLITDLSSCYSSGLQVTQLSTQFMSQTTLNGTGLSNNYGLLKPVVATSCSGATVNKPLFADGSNTFVEVSSVTGSCNTSLSSSTVAAYNHQCGDQIFISQYGSPGTLKTVQDECPKCQNDPPHFDNWLPGGGTSGLSLRNN